MAKASISPPTGAVVCLNLNISEAAFLMALMGGFRSGTPPTGERLAELRRENGLPSDYMPSDFLGGDSIYSSLVDLLGEKACKVRGLYPAALLPLPVDGHR